MSRLTLLHHRLSALMALAALVAFGAGAGFASPEVVLTAAALGVALVWTPPPEWSAGVERAVRLGAIGLLAWVAYVALVVAGDFLVPLLALLLYLLAGEVLRGPAAHAELRRYSLAFALLVAATAYYPGPLFAAAFVAYVALTTVAMMVGHLRRETERHGIAELRLGRHFLLATAALSGLTVLTGALLFAAFPRLPRNWFGPARGAGSGVMVGFGDGVSLGDFGTRISPNPEIVFRVEFDDGAPPGGTGALYWRGRSYDHFDGVRWTRSRGLPPAAPPPAWYEARWGGPRTSYRIYGGPPGADVLFGLHPLLAVWPVTALRAFGEANGDVRFRGSDAPSYRAVSLVAAPGAAALRAAPEGRAPASDHHLQLPRLSGRVYALADSLTRGEPTRYDRVRAVERFFQHGFAYTTELPPTPREATLEHFLFERRAGHCEYYSTAMAVLLRAAGIEARNVTGFAGGEWAPGGYLAVTQNQAHSWVEVWFPEYGWVRFDPTPAAGAAARAAAGAGAAAPVWRLRLWLGGLEHRWYKWVIFYDLDKQLGLLRQVSELFGRDRAAPRRWERAEALRRLAPWAAAVGIAALLAWTLRGARRSGRRPSPEARAYLALRRAYARAGFAAPDEAPLALVEALDRTRAPGREAARRIVDRYVRARFGGEEIGDAARREMTGDLHAVRRALRRRAAPV